MIIVFPYCHKDHDQALRLAGWLSEIGPFLNHDLLTIRDVRAPLIPELRALFRSSKELAITDDVHNSWPQSPNLMFAKAAKYIEYRPKQPWLWLEPDAIPLRTSAFDEIEAEYQRAVGTGKFFLGDFVHLPEPGFKDHMSGVAVYPPNMTHHAGDATISLDIAWDVQAARQILPKMFQSELILHRWKHPPFTSWEEVEQRIFAVRPKCALYHADKLGSLIELLRGKKRRTSSVFTGIDGKPIEHPPFISLPNLDFVKELKTPDEHLPPIEEMETAEEIVPSPIHQDEIWVKLDANGLFIDTYEFNGKEWVPATWPRDTSNYHVVFTPSPITPKPWESKKDSLAEIQRLADRLKQFGDNASHVRAVRMILNDTGVITLPYRFKKRGKWRRKRKET